MKIIPLALSLMTVSLFAADRANALTGALLPLPAEQWTPPTVQQVETALAKVPPGQAVVACATYSCTKAASAIAQGLGTKGWNVKVIHHGGIGIDGVSGIRVESCTDRANAVTGALLPLLKGVPVEVASDGACSPTREPWSVVIVIGTMP